MVVLASLHYPVCPPMLFLKLNISNIEACVDYLLHPAGFLCRKGFFFFNPIDLFYINIPINLCCGLFFQSSALARNISCPFIIIIVFGDVYTCC